MGSNGKEDREEERGLDGEEGGGYLIMMPRRGMKRMAGSHGSRKVDLDDDNELGYVW